MDTPSLTNGRKGVKDPVLENLNVLSGGSPLKYHFISHGLKRPARVIEHELEGEGVHLGVDIRSAGPRKGPINFQLNKADDTPPSGAHILKLTIGSAVSYFGASDNDDSASRNAVKRLSISVIELINPFFQALLSEGLGDSLQASYSKTTVTGTTTATFDPVPVNHRTGATKAYAATQADGSALPAGVAISGSTGVITLTGASLVVGDYVIKVTLTDTLTTLPADHPWRVLENEQTLYLSIAA